tara:strand:+ start:3528 stop:4628 length:1101 start_codon:yes stop_codon:yes gene_type:complete
MKNPIIYLLLSILLINCQGQSNKERISESNETSLTENIDNVDLRDIKGMIQKSGPYSRDSGDFFGVEALVFDGNTVRFTVASLYVLGEIIDREDITGTYDVSSNGSTITLQFSFNTNFVFVDYLIDGSKKSRKSIKEVSVPYIIKGSIKDGQVILKDWENQQQQEERKKKEEMELNKEKIVEDYGIDKNTLLGNYVNQDKKVLLTINNIDQKELTENRKSGIISGTINVDGKEKSFETEYETYHPGNRYSFSVKYGSDKGGRKLGLRLSYENGLSGNFFSDSGQTSQIFDLTKSNKTPKNLTTYYKINDPDGYSNLRDRPNGKVVRKVLDNEKFEVMGSEGDFKKVKLMDGTMGYIHQSRVVEIDQ